MKKTIKPLLLQAISSDWRLQVRRQFFKAKRILLRKSAQLSVYIKVDDPYSFLLLQALPSIEERFKVDFSIKVISTTDNVMFPEPTLWENHALNDAMFLAQLYNFLPVPAQETGLKEPNSERTMAYTIKLQDAINNKESWPKLIRIVYEFWETSEGSELTELTIDAGKKNSIEEQVKANTIELSQRGHYLPATVYYDGEWYWGVDRLDHLEQRLSQEQLKLTNVTSVVFNRTYNLERKRPDIAALPTAINDDVEIKNGKPIELFWSARSPYSHIALLEGISLASTYQVPLVVRPVLPMMMRGLFVPFKKALYIFLDTKREAKKLGWPYGKLADPLGDGVKRCYSLLNYARDNGRFLHYLVAFSEAVNTKGIRAETDKGLKKIVEKAGLDWEQAKQHLTNRSWQDEVERNQQDMYSKGNWGVPVFRYQDIQVWGQDRIFVIENAIKKDLVG